MTKRKFSFPMALVYLVLIIWGLTTVYPIIWVIQNSFKDRTKIIENSFSLPFGELFTSANYRRAFRDMNVFDAYKNSIFISCMVCILVILLAGLASYALVRYTFKMKAFLNTLVISAMMFPVYATIIPVMTMENSWGLAFTKNWLLSMFSVILPQVAGNLAFSIVVLSGYIKGLPIELEEAAFMEGCNPFQIFFRVIVPLTKPSFATVAIFSFLWSYNDLFTQLFFLRREDNKTITILLNHISSQEGTDYGLMAASVALVVVPVLIVYIFLQKYIIKGMTAGAVKG